MILLCRFACPTFKAHRFYYQILNSSFQTELHYSKLYFIFLRFDIFLWAIFLKSHTFLFRIRIWSKYHSFLFLHLIKTELFVTSVAVYFACHCVINCFFGWNRKQVDTIEDIEWLQNNHIDIFKRNFKHTTRESIIFVLSFFLTKCRSNFLRISIKSWTIHSNTVKGISKWHIYIKPNWQHLKK